MLDDLSRMKEIDSQDMLAEIKGLPHQLEQAFNLGMSQKPPGSWMIRKVVIAGMGGSAIGGDLLSAYLNPRSTIPILVNRDYDLPGWANGQDTLVIASSHSGNTEETLSALKQAIERGCTVVGVSTGGELMEICSRYDVLHWKFEHGGMPRAAVGFSFGLLLALFSRLGLIAVKADEVTSTAQIMAKQQIDHLPEVSSVNNPAKQIAQKLFQRNVLVLASGTCAPVARRWKGQINELAKGWANFEYLPEADHNTLAGTLHPHAHQKATAVVFLKSALDHPRNLKRMELTREQLSDSGYLCLEVEGVGGTELQHLWTLLLYGDYVSYYLAILYGTDPTPILALEKFKQAMKG